MSKKTLYNGPYSANVLSNFGKNTKKYNTRLKQILKLVKFGQNEKILEIGANKGDLVNEISKYSNSVTGIDFNSDAVSDAKSDKILFMNAEKLEFPDNSFDKIISIHTIEHIPDIKKALSEMDRVLTDNGEIVLFYPMEIIRGTAALRDAIFAHKSIFAAKKLHLHKLTPNKLKKLLSGTNLKSKKNGIYFEPVPAFYTLLEKCKPVN